MKHSNLAFQTLNGNCAYKTCQFVPSIGISWNVERLRWWFAGCYNLSDVISSSTYDCRGKADLYLVSLPPSQPTLLPIYMPTCLCLVTHLLQLTLLVLLKTDAGRPWYKKAKEVYASGYQP